MPSIPLARDARILSLGALCLSFVAFLPATQDDAPVDLTAVPHLTADEFQEAVPAPPAPPPGAALMGPVAPAGRQPQGALSGRIVFTSAGHGWTANTSGSGSPWFTQRGDNNEIVEDLQNQDQMTMYVFYCFNAGATVVPFRPVGHQVVEVVLDNDDPGVTFTPPAAWINSTSTVFYGSPGDVPYRYASKSLAGETAVARYTPNLPRADFYPVYCWTRDGVDRIADQLYRIVHSGGITEVRINHRRVGKGWIYLGTYHFEQGTGGYVEISNDSSDANPSSQFVFADAIRFGNGMGDVDRGFGVSGYPREEEASRYWVQRGLGQGTSSSIYDGSGDDQTDNVGTPPRMAANMNRESEGAFTSRVYLGFHSNASPGSLGLYNGNNDPSTATPNQFQWALLVGTECRDDMVAIGSPPLEGPWVNNANPTLDRSDIEFGEINNNYINNEFDASIIEVAGHVGGSDPVNLRNPNVRNWLARACYQATVRYFNQFDGAPLNLLPEPPTNVRALVTGPGTVTVSWEVPLVDGIGGDAATGYVVYRSTNGYGFDSGTVVSGGATTSHVVSGLPAGQVTFFRVAATNAGGESMPSETVVARPSSAGNAQILIVNGFDRLDRFMNPLQTEGPGIGGPAGGTETFERVIPRRSNAFDYVVQVAQAVAATAPGGPLGIDSCQNEAVINGQVDLSTYDAVVWIAGEESTGDETFNATEQTRVAAFLAAGGNLLVSGAEIAWDLDRPSGPTAADRAFLNNQLRADYVGDDANTHSVTATAGGIFDGNAGFAFDDGNSGTYDVNFPDQLTPIGGGAQAALSYVGGLGGTAAVQYNGASGGGRSVYLGFPFETITTATARAQVMEDVLNFFGTSVPAELSAFGFY